MALVSSPDELQALNQVAIKGRRPTLSDFSTGSNLNALSWAASIVGEEVLLEALRLFQNCFFSTDDRVALVALIQDRFAGQLVVQGETSAQGTLLLERPSADAGDVTIELGDEFYDADLPLVTFTAEGADVMVSTSLEVPVTCTLTGTQGNLSAGVIDSAARELGDASIVITNPERMAGGAPEETIDELKALVKEFYQSLVRATIPAIMVGAKSVLGVRVVAVDKSKQAYEDGGYLRVLVGDAEGNANQALTEAVDAELVNWVAGGVMWRVEGVVREVYPLEVSIRTAAALDFGPIVENVKSALLLYGYTLNSDSQIFISQLERVAINTSPYDKGGVILDVDVRVKVDGEWLSTDVTPSAGAVPRFETESITLLRWGA